MLRSIFGMDKWILIAVFFWNSYSSASIVYVHIGSKIPQYLYVALEQARLFNAAEEIYLIANQAALNNSGYNFAQHGLTTVPCESLEQSEYHKVFNKQSQLDDKYREGFWRKATERFFYLHELIASRTLKNVVHLESDNLLYVDISTIKEALSRYAGIGAVFDSDSRCIPSFVYIANESAISHLVQFIAKYSAQNHNDMEMFALYRNTFSQKEIDNLPLIMPEYVKDHSLENALRQKTSRPVAYVRHIDAFNSIFDGAAIGQYLGGIDPRNGPSLPGFVNETCLFNPSYLVFEWRKDGRGRKVPFAVYNGSAYRINNLHIHSKKLDDFRS